MTYEKQKTIKWHKFLTKEEQAVIDDFEQRMAELEPLRARMMLIRSRATSRAIRHRSKS